MKLTRNGIKERGLWEKAGITLPGYDVEEKQPKEQRRSLYGFIVVSEIFSVYLLVVLQMVFWKKGRWTGESPA